jgi:hypothetical protein
MSILNYYTIVLNEWHIIHTKNYWNEKRIDNLGLIYEDCISVWAYNTFLCFKLQVYRGVFFITESKTISLTKSAACLYGFC